MDLETLLLYFLGLLAPAVVGLLVFRLAVYIIKSASED